MSKAIEVLKKLDAEFGEAMKHDDPICGSDAVDVLAQIWPSLRAALAEEGQVPSKPEPNKKRLGTPEL